MAPAIRARALLVLGCVLALLTLAAPAASAHVVPTSTIQLDVGEGTVAAAVGIPVSDIASATGLDLGDGSPTAVNTQAAAIRRYLLAHFAPTGDDGRPWSVDIGSLAVTTTGNATTTGRYQELQTTFTLTPPAGGDEQSFDLGYDAVVERVATHVVIVTARSGDNAYAVGTISRDTVTNTVQPLHVDLGSGSEYRGFTGLVTLGVQHIREGTDHQLFLLTLLLPAPLLARGPRWSGAAPARRAVHRIATITLAFTLGHSMTLALGALGLPVPQQLVESLIAVSILVAAVHAVRPIFAGREAWVAASFGLVHGLAFSEALRALDLSGGRLVLALLGFNLGIEAMQLIVVGLVLPPLVLLARSDHYRMLRTVAAAATAVAAVGWLGARLGLPNPVADVADRMGGAALPAVAGLWLAALSTHRDWSGVRDLTWFQSSRYPSRPLFTLRRSRPRAEPDPDGPGDPGPVVLVDGTGDAVRQTGAPRPPTRSSCDRGGEHEALVGRPPARA